MIEWIRNNNGKRDERGVGKQELQLIGPFWDMKVQCTPSTKGEKKIGLDYPHTMWEDCGCEAGNVSSKSIGEVQFINYEKRNQTFRQSPKTRKYLTYVWMQSSPRTLPWLSPIHFLA